MTSAEEIWKPVAGFPGYEVSSLGRVISHRKWRGSKGPRQLSGGVRSDGYRIVGMTAADGSQRHPYVHHIVTEAFHGERPAGLEVRHLDGDSLNNAASNLRYGTSSENSLDTVRHGTHNRAGKDQCINGHPYTAENTGFFPSENGARHCVTCKHARIARRTAA